MSHKSTILIVDDEPVGRQLIDAILYKEGYNLEFAENGQEAYDKAINLNPDLVLLDVMMPEIDGFEVCQRLRAQASTANVPIILVTALDDIDSRIRGLEAGADDYISKPFDRLELLARVKIITRLNRYRNTSAGEKPDEQTSIVNINQNSMVETMARSLSANVAYKSGFFNDVWTYKKEFEGTPNNFFTITEREGKAAIFNLGAIEKESSDTLSYLTMITLFKTIIESEEDWLPDVILNKLKSTVKDAINDKKITLDQNKEIAASLSILSKQNNTILYAGSLNPFVLVKKEELLEATGDEVDLVTSGPDVFHRYEIDAEPGEVIFFMPKCFYKNEAKDELSISFVKNILKLSLGTRLKEISGALEDIVNNNKKFAEYCNQFTIAGFRL